MRRFLLLALLVLCSPLWAAQYFMSPTGLDTNDGLTTATPWLTPNHAGLFCGDVITAASGDYAQILVNTTPTCTRHDAVWVKCAVFDTCKVAVTLDGANHGAIQVYASYWAFTGWETTTSSSSQTSCFFGAPGNQQGHIHDIYFINDIANGCIGGGFNTDNVGSLSVDYVVYIAVIAYNASQGNSQCWSGVNVLQPFATDTLPGTHIYSSQVFSWHNIEPSECAGGPSTDGEGIIYDTFNGIYVRANGDPDYPPYAQQAAIENVLTMYNGAGGIDETGSGNSAAYITIQNSTSAYNFTDPNQNTPICGQINDVGVSSDSDNINWLTNINNNIAVATATANGCKANPVYAIEVGNIDGPSTAVYRNRTYSPVNQDIGLFQLTTGFVAGPANISGVDPAFANPAEPPAPNCAGKASVIDCMSDVIAAFTPTATGFDNYGYHAPSSTPVVDPLFPRLLCNNPNMPTGLVTMGCISASGTNGLAVSKGMAIR